MRFIFWLSVIIALAMVWSLWGRDWLKNQNWEWSNIFFAWIEPIEIKVWKNSKTIFMARLKMLTGMLLTLATQTGSIDITPLMPIVPDAWESTFRAIWNMLPLTVTLLGWMDEWLRRESTKPLEMVALPENKPPEVAQAEAKIDAAVAEAKLVVAVAKAEGAV